MPDNSPPRFVKVDDLMASPRATLENVARYYGVELPELKRTGAEIRLRCFLNCGRTEPTSDRALAIQTDTASKVWRCFAKGCGKSGNLLSLMDLLAPGKHMQGRPRGARFKELARDLEAIVAGHVRAPVAATEANVKVTTNEREANVPLAQSDNERARELVTLDEQFVYPDAIETMPPAASRYFRARTHVLTPETCRQHRVGYLPQSAKSLLRGKIVYPYFDAQGNLLTWFGRNPAYEEVHRRWSASDRSGPEPQKFQFVKGFLKGLEIWGQHVVRLGTGLHTGPLVVVEGPNDCLRLQQAGLPAVALCGTTISQEQAVRIAALATDMRCTVVQVMLDNDAEGNEGLAQVVPLLAEHVAVRVMWSKRSAPALTAREPESLSDQELDSLLRATSAAMNGNGE